MRRLLLIAAATLTASGGAYAQSPLEVRPPNTTYKQAFAGQTRAELNERIGDVIVGPDGALYVATDSPKGRVLRITPKT